MSHSIFKKNELIKAQSEIISKSITSKSLILDVKLESEDFNRFQKKFII